MAGSYTGATSVIERTSSPVSGTPFTIAAWVKTANNDNGAVNTIVRILASVADTANSNFNLHLSGNLTNDVISFDHYSSTAQFASAATTTGISVNQWHHVCAVAGASNDRRVFIDGTSKGASTVNRANATLAHLRIGLGIASKTMEIADVAVWNVGFTDLEVAQLSKPFSHKRYRPQNLVAFFSMVRAMADFKSGVAVTVTDVGVTSHPRLYN